MWHRLNYFSVWDSQRVERWWHAGLSSDGRRCVILGIDSHPVIVWDVPGRRIVCILDGPEPPEDEWTDLGKFLDTEGNYVIPDGPGAGRYRIFGIHEQHGRTVDERHGVRLEVDTAAGIVRVIRINDTAELAALRYEWFSGDWAFASFSEDSDVLAVIEPYYVTFFARECSEAKPSAAADPAPSAGPGS